MGLGKQGDVEARYGIEDLVIHVVKSAMMEQCQRVTKISKKHEGKRRLQKGSWCKRSGVDTQFSKLDTTRCFSQVHNVTTGLGG